MIIFAISILVLICIVSLITKKSNDRQENPIKESNPIIKQKVMTYDEKLTNAKDALSQQFSYYKEFITDEDCENVVEFWNLRDNKLDSYSDYIELKHNLYEELSNRKASAEKLKYEENEQAKERIYAKLTYGEKVTLLASLIKPNELVWIKLEKELNGENK